MIGAESQFDDDAPIPVTITADPTPLEDPCAPTSKVGDDGLPSETRLRA